MAESGFVWPEKWSEHPKQDTQTHTHTRAKRLGIDLRLQFKLITSSPPAPGGTTD